LIYHTSFFNIAQALLDLLMNKDAVLNFLK